MKVPESLQGLVQGLHHVAIAIEDLDAARVLYVDQLGMQAAQAEPEHVPCLLYTSPSPRDLSTSRMPSSA